MSLRVYLVPTSRLGIKLVFVQTQSRLGGLVVDSCKLASLDRVTRVQWKKNFPRYGVVLCSLLCDTASFCAHYSAIRPKSHSGLGILLRAFCVCPCSLFTASWSCSNDTRVRAETRRHATQRHGAVVGWIHWKPRVPPTNTTSSREATSTTSHDP